MAVCIAIIGKENAPKYIACTEKDQELDFHYKVHSSLDIIEEKLSSTSLTKGTDLREQCLGLLYATEEHKMGSQYVTVKAVCPEKGDIHRWLLTFTKAEENLAVESPKFRLPPVYVTNPRLLVVNVPYRVLPRSWSAFIFHNPCDKVVVAISHTNLVLIKSESLGFKEFYGYVTNTKIKIVIVIDANHTALRDNEIRAMFRKLHGAYADAVCNPFYIPGDPITSKKFCDIVHSLLVKS